MHSVSQKMTQMAKWYMMYTFQVLATRAYIYMIRILCPADDTAIESITHAFCVQTTTKTPCLLCVHAMTRQMSRRIPRVWVCVYIYIHKDTMWMGALFCIQTMIKTLCAMWVCTLFCAQATMKTCCVHYCVSGRCWEYPVGAYIILCSDDDETTMLVGAVSGRWWEHHVVGWKILCPDDHENAMSAFCVQTMTW